MENLKLISLTKVAWCREHFAGSFIIYFYYILYISNSITLNEALIQRIYLHIHKGIRYISHLLKYTKRTTTPTQLVLC